MSHRRLGLLGLWIGALAAPGYSNFFSVKGPWAVGAITRKHLPRAFGPPRSWTVVNELIKPASSGCTGGSRHLRPRQAHR